MLFLTNILLITSVFNIGALGNVKRPNFVLFVATNSDVELGGMTPLQNVKQLIGNLGTTFLNAFTVSPSSCPSRASLLTGMYPHNHLTLNSTIEGGCYDKEWQDLFEQITFATELQEAGYKTFYAGKYLDNYGKKAAGGPKIVPPGWSDWHALSDYSGGYFNFTLSNNGVAVNMSDAYLTDVLRDFAIQFIEGQTEKDPFLMLIAPNAPQSPPMPAPRHKGRYRDIKAPRTPNFNTVAGMDKHWLLRMQPSPIPDHFISNLDEIYRSRWETLLSVDEMVADVVSALDSRNLLNNTFLVYTADSGFHVGQFSQFSGYHQPYDTDIKIPLVISGPGIPQNQTLSTPVLNIDIAPSMMNLVGLQPPANMDGNLVEFNPDKDKLKIKGDDDNDRYMLIEHFGEGCPKSNEEGCVDSSDDGLFGCTWNKACKCDDAKNNTFGCIRSIAKHVNMKYCRFQDNENFTEMYNLSLDPYEQKNIYHEMSSALVFWYELTLEKLSLCSGSTECNTKLVGWGA